MYNGYYSSPDFLEAHNAKLVKRPVKGAKFPVRTRLELVYVPKRQIACIVCGKPVHGFWKAEGAVVCSLAHLRRFVAEQGGKKTAERYMAKFLNPPTPETAELAKNVATMLSKGSWLLKRKNVSKYVPVS